jgi:hypothetical protein
MEAAANPICDSALRQVCNSCSSSAINNKVAFIPIVILNTLFITLKHNALSIIDAYEEMKNDMPNRSRIEIINHILEVIGC